MGVTVRKEIDLAEAISWPQIGEAKIHEFDIDLKAVEELDTKQGTTQAKHDDQPRQTDSGKTPDTF